MSEKPLSEAQIHEFLKNLLVDSEEWMDPVEGEPDFVRWLPLRMDDRDFLLRAYTRDSEHPLQLAAEASGAGYAVAMTALIHLRHWWYESESFFTAHEVTQSQFLSALQDDLQTVTGLLSQVQVRLSRMEAGMRKTEREKAECLMEMRQAGWQKAKREWVEADQRKKKAKARDKLASLLEETPIEQLSRQALPQPKDKEEN
ncbi:hypothetical protein CMI37_16485 [Candidatus Pacearchaeota archaeon]|nr:hypothetical protein [Candidatus Pacearchaeota archaeon]|tara:strand:- start:492 stop:1094 length:603 start_codon:yes stop_codon:yes gene_type:complete